MAEIEQKTVLTIDTSKSVNSVKDLKDKIKDLKDEIVRLESAGEDCSKEYAELGTSMRQLADINENAKRASKDLGDQLSVVTGSFKGVAGAISTVTGVMGLLGAESTKTEKLVKTMVSAMSITTGIQAMEQGFKSVKQLASGFVIAARGAKTLGGAIKAAFMSNPIGILITALTAAIALFSSLNEKAKEAAENMKKSFEATAAALKADFDNIISGGERSVGALLNRNLLNYRKFIWSMEEETKDMFKVFAAEGDMTSNGIVKDTEEAYDYIVNVLEQVASKTKPTMEELIRQAETWEGAVGVAMDEAKKKGEEYSDGVLKVMKKAQTATEEMIEREIAANRFQAENLQNYLQFFSKTSEEYSKIKEKITELNKEYKQLAANYIKVGDEVSQYEENLKKQQQTRQTAAQEALRTQKENAKKELETEKKKIEDHYKLLQAQTQRTLDINKDRYTQMLRNGEISQEEYNAKMLEFENAYYTASEKQLRDYMEKMKALQETMRKNKYLTQEDVDAIYTPLQNNQYLQQLDEYRRNINNNNYDAQVQQNENAVAKEELEQYVEILNRKLEIERQNYEERQRIEEEYLNETNRLEHDQNEKQLELLQQQREYETQMYELFQQENAGKMGVLNEQLSMGLITAQDFTRQMADLNAEMEEREMEHKQTMIDIKTEEIETKKNIEKNYQEFQSSIMSSTASILNSMADRFADSEDDMKGIRIAATLISMLQGSIAAYTGMVETIPGVPGIVAGAAAAAAVIAQGIATINQMNQVNTKSKRNTTSKFSSGAVNTFTAPVANSQLTGMSNDFTDMMGNAVGDQRVYVTVGDINDGQNRRAQVVNNNTF